jgi:hypothetical protein
MVDDLDITVSDAGTLSPYFNRTFEATGGGASSSTTPCS